MGAFLWDLCAFAVPLSVFARAQDIELSRANRIYYSRPEVLNALSTQVSREEYQEVNQEWRKR